MRKSFFQLFFSLSIIFNFALLLSQGMVEGLINRINEDDLPIWFFSPPVEDDRLYAFGISDLDLSPEEGYEQALMRGRIALSFLHGMEVKTIMKDWITAEPLLTEYFEESVKCISSLLPSDIIKIEEEHTLQNGIAMVLVSIPANSDNSVSDDQIDEVIFRFDISSYQEQDNASTYYSLSLSINDENYFELESEKSFKDDESVGDYTNKEEIYPDWLFYEIDDVDFNYYAAGFEILRSINILYASYLTTMALCASTLSEKVNYDSYFGNRDNGDLMISGHLSLMRIEKASVVNHAEGKQSLYLLSSIPRKTLH